MPSSSPSPSPSSTSLPASPLPGDMTPRERALRTVAAYWARFLRAPNVEAPQVGGSPQTGLDAVHALLAKPLPPRSDATVAAFEAALFAALDAWGDSYYQMVVRMDYQPTLLLAAVCRTAGLTESDVRFYFPSKTCTELRSDWTVTVREGHGARPRILLFSDGSPGSNA